MRYILLFFSVLKNMGWGYVWFRMLFESKRKLGWLKKKFPTNPLPVKMPSLEEWREAALPFFFQGRESLNISSKDVEALKQTAKRILGGEIWLFHSEWKKLGKEYDWVTNPDSGFRYDVKKHWTEVEDFTSEAGDIKYVWEKSRFSYLYPVIRYDYHCEEDHSGFVFREIVDWIEKNPVNQGPNYKCSQEISLRVLNWVFALYFYKEAKELSGEYFDRIMQSIYWQMDHVYKNIQFSRKAVRNNHTITETLALYLIGMLFPFFPESGKWKKDGKRWFEQEIEYQIAEDGTYLQFSMNYHRVVVQLLTWAIALSDKNEENFSDVVYERAYRSVNFLYQCQDEASGWLPNYGANDGALFFDLSDSHYRDYRPQLSALYYLLTGTRLYEEAVCREDGEWYCSVGKMNTRKQFPPLNRKHGIVEFPVGGYYLIRESDILTFIRCGKYENRPSHADNLHVDVWRKGENILLDGGSFKYNTNSETVKYFSGTESHNTVMLGSFDQMLKGPRFIWLNWSQALGANLTEREDMYEFEGEVSCFTYLDKRIICKRVIKKYKERLIWVVEDEVINKSQDLIMRQLWHTLSNRLEVRSSENVVIEKQEGAYSSLYGLKEKVIQYGCNTKENKIRTVISMND